MNRRTLAEFVANQTGLSDHEARQALEAALDGIMHAMREGEKVTLSNFGTFSIRIRAPRVARNISTGERVEIPEHPTFHFRPSIQVQQALRRGMAVTARKRAKGTLS